MPHLPAGRQGFSPIFSAYIREICCPRKMSHSGETIHPARTYRWVRAGIDHSPFTVLIHLIYHHITKIQAFINGWIAFII